MTVELIYVHPVRQSGDEEFNEAARKFVASYKQYPPGCQHDLSVVYCNGQATPEMIDIYDGLTPTNVFYDGNGRDIGAQQSEAIASKSDFSIAVNSRVYFHKEGWLKRMVDAREQNGPGVYSAMASYEGCPLGQVWPNPHLRTAFYGMDSKLWREFPHTVNSREDSFRFESGEWNIANWCESNGYRAMLVSWGGCWNKNDWRKVPNGFRAGDQSNCLVWDRHCDIFFSNPAAQPHLTGLANGTP